MIYLILVLAVLALGAVLYQRHIAHMKRKAVDQAAWNARVEQFIVRREQSHLPPVA